MMKPFKCCNAASEARFVHKWRMALRGSAKRTLIFWNPIYS